MAKHLISELSVFFPAYNEEKNISETVLKAIKILEEVASRWEVVIVNDGSTDKTEQVVDRIIKKYHDKVRMITHDPNRGYGAALKSGLYNCAFKWIAFTDADGQFDFKEITHFIDTIKREKADLVIGYRLKREDPPLRIIIAFLLKLWNFTLFGGWFKDADCGFKLIKKSVVDTIPKLQTESAITETEFLIRAKRQGFKIVEIGVNHFSRDEGNQTGANPKVIWKAVKESFKLWKALQ